MFTRTRRTLFEKMFEMARVAWCLKSSRLNLNLGETPHSLMQSIPYIWLTVGLLICSTSLKEDKGNAKYYLCSKNNSALMEKVYKSMGNYSYLV